MSRRHYKSIGGGVLPAGYAECEYIESNGTQFLAIPWTIGTNLQYFNFEASIYPVQSTINYGGFLGTDKSSTIEGYYTRMNSGRFALFVYGSTTLYIDGKTYNNWYNVSLNFENSTKKMCVDGNCVQNSCVPNINLPQNLTFFKYSGSEQYQGRMKKVSACVRTSLGEINVRMIPCVRLADEKPGMYDLYGSICPLTGTPFYVNAGTGEFLYQLKS